jgi:hypothetical protein
LLDVMKPTSKSKKETEANIHEILWDARRLVAQVCGDEDHEQLSQTIIQ